MAAGTASTHNGGGYADLSVPFYYDQQQLQQQQAQQIPPQLLMAKHGVSQHSPLLQGPAAMCPSGQIAANASYYPHTDSAAVESRHSNGTVGMLNALGCYPNDAKVFSLYSSTFTFTGGNNYNDEFRDGIMKQSTPATPASRTATWRR